MEKEIKIIRNIETGENYKKVICHNESAQSFLGEVLSYRTETFKWNDKNRCWDEYTEKNIGDCVGELDHSKFETINTV